MSFAIGARVVVSALLLASVLALAVPLIQAVQWLAEKIAGPAPGKLRETLASMAGVFVAALISLRVNVMLWLVIALVVWRDFLR
jgi:hypothetical protein